MDPEDAKWEELQDLINNAELQHDRFLENCENMTVEEGGINYSSREIEEMAELYNTLEQAGDIMDAHSKGKI